LAKDTSQQQASRAAPREQAPRAKRAEAALQLLEQLEVLREEGATEIRRYVQLLSRAANDPNSPDPVRGGAALIRDLIEVRAQERRQFGGLFEALSDLVGKFKESRGSWPQGAHDLQVAAQNSPEKATRDLLDALRGEIQRFIDTYLQTILHTLRDPLKASELSVLLRHYLGKGKDEESQEGKSALEAEVAVEALRYRYALPLLLIQNIIGPKAVSPAARTLLTTFEEVSEEFPSVKKEAESFPYILRQYQNDPYIENDLKKARETLAKEDTTSRTRLTPLGETPGKAEPAEKAAEEVGPGPTLLNLSRTFYKTRAAKILDLEAGSMAPGQSDLLDDTLDYIHRIWKESLTWEPHPNYQQLRYFRDHLVRLLTSGHVMEQLFRSYRDVHRYEASQIVTLDTRKLLNIPSVREIVCLMLYPKLQRIPGFNGRVFEAMLGKQYASLMRCCHEIAGLDVFVHSEWPEGLDNFLREFDATYQSLIGEEAGSVRRFLDLFRRPL
jgi:hypothetical protein